MVFFGGKKEEKTKEKEELNKILTEIQNFKKDFRLLHDKVEQKVDRNRDDTIQYLYHVVSRIEGIEDQLASISNDIKKLTNMIEEKFKQTFSKIESVEDAVNITHEAQTKMIDQVLGRFTKLIEVVGDILQRELDIAKKKIEEELNKKIEMDEE